MAVLPDNENYWVKSDCAPVDVSTVSKAECRLITRTEATEGNQITWIAYYSQIPLGNGWPDFENSLAPNGGGGFES